MSWPRQIEGLKKAVAIGGVRGDRDDRIGRFGVWSCTMSANPKVDSTPTVQHAARLARLVDQISTIIVGKRSQIEDCVACLVAGGHLLIEDVPGVGKTTLAHALAVSLGLRFSRVQFTADLMPSDLVGVSVYERSTEAFVFHPGPVFAQVLLADEINRAGPKTQSALLEAMEEQQVSVENETRPLPKPFFVIATQNPSDQLGTYPLPESQLDRFLMCITLGYPDRQSERALLQGEDRRGAIAKLPAVMNVAELMALQQAVLQVHASEAVLDYLQALIAATRSGRWFVEGLSPRAGIALLRAAKARALLDRRDYVAPDDIQAVLPQTIAHRLVPVPGAGRGRREQVRAMMEAVPLQ
jgi:MoxR-like ATPase